MTAALPPTKMAAAAGRSLRSVAHMLTTTEFVIAVFAVLAGALLLPLSSGMRSAIVLLLIGLGVATFIGGGMHYVTSLFQ